MLLFWPGGSILSAHRSTTLATRRSGSIMSNRDEFEEGNNQGGQQGGLTKAGRSIDVCVANAPRLNSAAVEGELPWVTLAQWLCKVQ